MSSAAVAAPQLGLVRPVSRALFLFAVLIAAVPSWGTNRNVPSAADLIRIYEVAVRHFIETRPVPKSATLWLSVNARPAPKDLLSRFAGQGPHVRASDWHSGVHHDYSCGILDGTIISTEAYISVHGTPDHGAHFYHLRKQRGDWVLLEDAAGYVDEQ